MPNYEYAARDISGQIIRGRAEAENEKVLAQRLAREGYKVVSVRRERVAGAGFAIALERLSPPSTSLRT